MKRIIQVHVPYAVLAKRLEDFVEEGINPEIYMDAASLCEVKASELVEVRRAFEDRGMRITMHGPYSSLNPGSPSEEARLKTVETYRRAFDAAEALRPVNMVLHAGYSSSKYKGNKELWLEQSMKTWPEFAMMAEGLGLNIAVENIFETSPDTLVTLVGAVGSPNLGLCLDTGHLNAFAKGDMDEWVQALGPHLVEVHLHDNFGDNDDHLPVGEGEIDFDRLFGLLDRYAARGPVYTIEPHGEEMMRRGIAAITKRLGAG